MAKRRATDEQDQPRMLPSAVQIVQDHQRQPAAEESTAPSPAPRIAITDGDPADPIITMSDAARAFGKTQTTVKRWIMDGLLVAVRLPSGILGLRRSELRKFLGGTSLPQKEIA